jgi:hypothetical protein
MESSISSYYPSLSDIKDHKWRKIYSNVPLDPDEQAAIQTFLSYTSSNKISVPEW